jgi:hypothetical protein
LGLPPLLNGPEGKRKFAGGASHRILAQNQIRPEGCAGNLTVSAATSGGFRL